MGKRYPYLDESCFLNRADYRTYYGQAPPAGAHSTDTPNAYAIADAVAGAVALGIPQMAAAQLVRLVIERHGPGLSTGELLAKILFYHNNPN
jgi:hypothetical protein